MMRPNIRVFVQGNECILASGGHRKGLGKVGRRSPARTIQMEQCFLVKCAEIDRGDPYLLNYALFEMV